MKNKLETLLHSENNVCFAYLFGSYADDTFTDKSDLDVAVYLKDFSLDEKLSLHHILEKSLQKNVDLLCLNEVKNIYLLEAIITRGLVIKESTERDIFEVKTQHSIIDFKYFRKYIDAA
ncbi:MAG: nucleotidyltransferase domain-containing protein [Sulfurovum sp.]|nr:nucleotidyltransferase domain-containing protein [Sulfurovum sp.]